MVTVAHVPAKKEIPSSEKSVPGNSKNMSTPTITTGPISSDKNVENNNNSDDNVNTTFVQESCQVLRAVLDELESEREKRTKLENEVAALKLQAHMHMQKEEDKKMKEMDAKKITNAHSKAASVLLSALTEDEKRTKKIAKAHSKAASVLATVLVEETKKKKEADANKKQTKNVHPKVSSVLVNSFAETMTMSGGNKGPTTISTQAESKASIASEQRELPQALPTKARKEEHLDCNDNEKTNDNGDGNENDSLAERQTNEYPLLVAHAINEMFSKRNTIPTWNMTATLQLFFQDLYTTILPPLWLSSWSKKQRDADKKKRIKASIHRVYAECNKSFSSRLIRTEYEEVIVRPTLNRTALDFAKALLRDYKPYCNNGNGKDSQSSDCTGHHHHLKHHLEIKQLSIERNGYLDLVDALTSDNDAVQLSAKNAPGTLPLHATRFLEIMPWDDRSQDYISAYEQVIQWQCFDAKAQVWSDKIRLFPHAFSSMPLDCMEENFLDLGGNGDGDYFHTHNHTDIDAYFGIGGSSSRERVRTRTLSSSGSLDSGRSSSCNDSCYVDAYSHTQSPTSAAASTSVQKIQHAFGSLALNILLTNFSCTHILELSRGYPLPSRGLWEWCGNWHVEGSISGNEFSSLDRDGAAPNSVVTDSSNFDNISKSIDSDDGWTYSNDLAELMCIENRHMSSEYKKKLKVYKRMYRKRVWRRQRVLIDYPGISQGTKQMLRMNARNAKLCIATSKLTMQVQGMQNTLTQKEEEAERNTMQLMAQIAKMEACIEEKTKEIEKLSKGNGDLSIEEVKTKSENNFTTTPPTPRIDLNDVPEQTLSILPLVTRKEENKQSARSNEPSAKHNNAANEDGSSDTCTIESASMSEKEEGQDHLQVTESALGNDLPTFVGNWKRNRGGSILETMKSNVQTISEKARTLHSKQYY